MSIGQTLSAARRQAGLSVDDVSARTRLRATVVRAIENDDFALCGGDVYARGHIRTIATIVGADPAALVAEYDATVAEHDDFAAPGQLMEAELGARTITKVSQRRPPNWGLAAAVMVLVAVIVVASVNLLHHKAQPPAQASGTTSSAPAVVSQTPVVTTPAPSPVTSAPVEPPSSAVAEASVRVDIKVTTAKCWVEAWGSTGAVLWQGIMSPGDAKSFDDPQKVSLKLGNAPATDLTVNGVDIGAPSSSTSVASVSFGPGNPVTAQG